MDVTRAVFYAFDDKEWVSKLAMICLLTLAAIALMPFLFLGLVPVTLLLGYGLQVINNVRDGKQQILPRWEKYSDLLARGSRMLPAFFVYNLPLMLMSCCLGIMVFTLGDSVDQGFATISVVCCLLPLTALYIGFVWPMLAVATGRYARGADPKVFYQAIRLSDTVGALGSEAAQWVITSMVVNLVLGLVFAIPIIGWVIYGALLLPIQTHLLGQFLIIVDKKDPHNKKKAAA